MKYLQVSISFYVNILLNISEIEYTIIFHFKICIHTYTHTHTHTQHICIHTSDTLTYFLLAVFVVYVLGFIFCSFIVFVVMCT